MKSKSLKFAKSIALWLMQNTNLKDQQIVAYTGLDILEFKTINTDTTRAIHPNKIVKNFQLSNIRQYEKNGEIPLIFENNNSIITEQKLNFNYENITNNIIGTNSKKEKKYIPKVIKKKLPAIIAWLIQNNYELNVKKTAKFFQTQSATIEKYMKLSYENYDIIDPIQHKLITEEEIQSLI